MSPSQAIKEQSTRRQRWLFKKEQNAWTAVGNSAVAAISAAAVVFLKMSRILILLRKDDFRLAGTIRGGDSPGQRQGFDF